MSNDAVTIAMLEDEIRFLNQQNKKLKELLAGCISEFQMCEDCGMEHDKEFCAEIMRAIK
jgi:hypothetical protein